MSNSLQLPLPLQEIAERELNENTENLTEILNNFREWLKTQKHLKSRTDDKFLIAILRAAKHNTEKAKRKLDMFITLRTHLPEFYKNRELCERTKDLIRLGLYVPLPETLGEFGPRIIIVRLGCYDTKKLHVNDIYKALTLLMDLQIEEDANLRIVGTRIIVDGKNLTASHLMQFDLMTLRKMRSLNQDCANLRIKGIHLLNYSSMAMALISVVKTFLSDKNKSRIKMHGDNIEDLHKIIPRELLPVEYEGEAGSISEILENCIIDVEKNWDRLKEWENCGVDETKRPGAMQSITNLFGNCKNYLYSWFDNRNNENFT